MWVQCNYMRMNIDLINIGNSKGIRLPKSLIEACGFEKTLNLELKEGQLILSANQPLRQGWKEAFDKTGDCDLFSDDYIENDWDKEEWIW